jgi:hypothetical protein
MSTPTSLARRAYEHLGGDAEFRALLNAVLLRVRRFMAVPPEVDDPVIEAEFDALRRRLEAFLPAYRAACVALLARQLDPSALSELLEARDAALKRRLPASVSHGLQMQLERSRKQMGSVPLYGPGSAACD